MVHHTMDRRHFLGAIGSGAAVGALGSSCTDAPSDPTDPTEATRDPSDFGEAPMLSARVNAGELPPVKDRLPKEPYVVRSGVLVDDQLVDLRPGRYGGTLQLAQETPDFDPIISIGNNEPLIWAPNGFGYVDGEAFEANVVAGWEVNGDQTQFTFYLRQGLKWSDGEPVTVEDVRFAFEDVLSNEQLTPVVPLYLRSAQRSDGPLAALEVVDDETFVLSFEESYGSFPVQLFNGPGWTGYPDLIKPRHYLEQFHQTYASKQKLAELVKEASLPEGEWFNLFNAKQLTLNGRGVTSPDLIGHPVLTPWLMKEASSGVHRYERNPYYFKVDADGNQLPYIDEIRSQVVTDKETLTSRALFGEFDYLGERASLRQLSLIAERAESGDLKVFVPKIHSVNDTVYVNLTHQDEVWRAVVRDAQFRHALSFAINREEIIENFFLGEFASLPEEIQPDEYDPDEASRLLDQVGLDQRDEDDFRLGPDGERFTIPFELTTWTEDMIPIGELVAEYWRAVGVHTTVRSIAASLWGERVNSNQVKATLFFNSTPTWDGLPKDHYLPAYWWAGLWRQWYDSGGQAGEEPPDEIKELYDLHSTVIAEPFGSPESKRALDEIARNHRENRWYFFPHDDGYFPTFFTRRLKNVPTGVKQDVFGIIVTYSMESWFIDE